MRRIGLLKIGGVPIRIYERAGTTFWGEFDAEKRSIVVNADQDRYLLISTLIHEISHAVDHLMLAGTKLAPENRAQAMGAALAACWDELTRIVNRKKVRR